MSSSGGKSSEDVSAAVDSGQIEDDTNSDSVAALDVDSPIPSSSRTVTSDSGAAKKESK